MRDSSSHRGERYTTVRHGGQMALAYAPGSHSAAVLVSLMRFAKWPDRFISVPRAVIADDTGLNEKQVRNAIYRLLHARAPDPETGELVPLLELERAGGRGRASTYRLNIANVDGFPIGYELARLDEAPNSEATDREPRQIGTPRQALGASKVVDRDFQTSPLKNKRNKKIKEEEESPRPHEFLRRDQFRAPCRACGGSHVFTLEDSTRGLAHCTAKGRTVTAEVPGGLRVACDVYGYRIDRKGAA